MLIDTTFDFTSDTPGYWDNFWENRDGLGVGSSDPDALSPTLRVYHRYLWSKCLPNGETMELKEGTGGDYLSWKDFRFGSDSILVTFRYKRYRHIIEQLEERLENYKTFAEEAVHRMYTIGGMIIFPKRRNGINQSRGCNNQICDRWDLTLECIRRFYKEEDSPLYSVLKEDKAFFDLFIDFKGYVDYFFLQDCVDSDYESVKFWEGDGLFRDQPLPKTVESYLLWIEREYDFLEKRNKRINDWQQTQEIGIS